MHMRASLILPALLLLTSACSTLESSAPTGNRSISPDQVARGTLVSNSSVIEWGGVIVGLENLKQTTELQIIAYPLLRDGKPDTDEPPLGRFIAVSEGYLESGDYARGRRVTVSGTVDSVRSGKVGQADYTFPLLITQQIRLWPKQNEGALTPRFNFGLGVGSGGSTHGGVGIGIGF